MMNFRIIVYILGWVLNMEAIFMLLPFAVGLFYRECAAYGLSDHRADLRGGRGTGDSATA